MDTPDAYLQICRLARRFMFLRVLFSLTAVLFLASSCGGEETESEQGIEGPAVFLSKDITVENDVLLEVEQLFQEDVAACMANEGFEYFPVDDSAENELVNDFFRQVFGTEFERIGNGLPSVEYAEEFGFGIAQGLIVRSSDSISQLPSDPNQAVVDALSASDVGAYSSALGMCEDGADRLFADVFSDQEVALEVGEAVSQRLVADSRIVTLNREWLACVSGSGLLESLPEVPQDPPTLRFMVEFQFFDFEGTPEEFLDLERGLALTAAECAEPLDYARILGEVSAELQDQELRNRGFGQ